MNSDKKDDVRNVTIWDSILWRLLSIHLSRSRPDSNQGNGLESWTDHHGCSLHGVVESPPLIPIDAICESRVLSHILVAV